MADSYTPVGTWDLVPDTFPDTVKVMRPSVRSSASAGVVLRRQTQSSESPAGVAAKRSFLLRFALATRTEYKRAIELWELTRGGAEGLNFTTSTWMYEGGGSSETLVVRMKAAPFGLRRVTAVAYQFSVSLEEMFHAP